MSKSRQYLLKVEVEPLDAGGYLATCPDLQGCHAEGETIAEALENVEDVARISSNFAWSRAYRCRRSSRQEQIRPLYAVS